RSGRSRTPARPLALGRTTTPGREVRATILRHRPEHPTTSRAAERLRHEFSAGDLRAQGRVATTKAPTSQAAATISPYLVRAAEASRRRHRSRTASQVG